MKILAYRTHEDEMRQRPMSSLSSSDMEYIHVQLNDGVFVLALVGVDAAALAQKVKRLIAEEWSGAQTS